MRCSTLALLKALDRTALLLAGTLVGAGCAAIQPESGRVHAADAIMPGPVAIVSEVSADAPLVDAARAGEASSADASTLWVPLGIFSFDYDDSTMASADFDQAAEIAQHLKRNPALRIVIDGSVNPRGFDAHNRGLRDRRVEVVREALIAAGVAPYIIETGAIGRDRALGDRSVEVLVRTTR